MLPHTHEVLVRLIENYNAAIWPAQAVAYGLGILVVALALRPRRHAGRLVTAVLAAAWLWVGVVYHVMHYVTINWAAWAFGALFVMQGFFLAWTGTLRGRFEFRFVPDLHGWIGLGLVVLSMAAHPLAGWLTGDGWPRVAAFGVTPDPVAAFTLGMLLLAAHRVPLSLLAIPVLWSLIGGATAWLMEVPRDLVLPLAAVSGALLIVRKNRRMAGPVSAPPASARRRRRRR